MHATERNPEQKRRSRPTKAKQKRRSRPTKAKQDDDEMLEFIRESLLNGEWTLDHLHVAESIKRAKSLDDSRLLERWDEYVWKENGKFQATKSDEKPQSCLRRYLKFCEMRVIELSPTYIRSSTLSPTSRLEAPDSIFSPQHLQVSINPASNQPTCGAISTHAEQQWRGSIDSTGVPPANLTSFAPKRPMDVPIRPHASSNASQNNSSLTGVRQLSPESFTSGHGLARLPGGHLANTHPPSMVIRVPQSQPHSGSSHFLPTTAAAFVLPGKYAKYTEDEIEYLISAQKARVPWSQIEVDFALKFPSATPREARNLKKALQLHKRRKKEKETILGRLER